MKNRFKTIFFDADDTLWENERYFRDAEARFAELLSDYTSPDGVQQMLWQKQEDNIPLFGYGSKTYMIGMTDAALELCGGHLPNHIYYGVKKIITDLLKNEMGFDGVVITDGITMAGVFSLMPYEDLIVEIVNAGADVILCAWPDATDIIEKAIADGRIEESRIDDACQRVLNMKEKQKMATSIPRREASEEIYSTDTLNLYFLALEL